MLPCVRQHGVTGTPISLLLVRNLRRIREAVPREAIRRRAELTGAGGARPYDREPDGE
jgi:hypothetical protein